VPLVATEADNPTPGSDPTSREAERRVERRHEAAPAAFTLFLVLVLLALFSWARGWEFVDLPWWVWLTIAAPALLLTVDLELARRGKGLVRSRRAALALLGLIVLGSFVALAILVAGLVSESSSDLTGGELLLTALAIYTTDVIVFGLLFWELEVGRAASTDAAGRVARDFRFAQDDGDEAIAAGWRPRVWDYLYVSLTNSIAFSPTDTMPLSLRAKAMMGLESVISAVTILLVAARAVNVLGS
jgi:uncharacterized membrane protein